MIKYLFLFSLVLLFSCTSKKNNNKDELNSNIVQKVINDTIKETEQLSEAISNVKSLYSLFSLKAKNGLFLGTIFVNKIKQKDVFDHLILINEKDTIYTIEKHILKNKSGIDIDIRSEDFFGYKIILVGEDNFVIQGLFNEGKEVSDDIHLFWNYEENIFEVMKTP